MIQILISKEPEHEEVLTPLKEREKNSFDLMIQLVCITSPDTVTTFSGMLNTTKSQLLFSIIQPFCHSQRQIIFSVWGFG